jgi:hypothetical protein
MQLDLSAVYKQEANSGNAELGVNLICCPPALPYWLICSSSLLYSERGAAHLQRIILSERELKSPTAAKV